MDTGRMERYKWMVLIEAKCRLDICCTIAVTFVKDPWFQQRSHILATPHDTSYGLRPYSDTNPRHEHPTENDEAKDAFYTVHISRSCRVLQRDR